MPPKRPTARPRRADRRRPALTFTDEERLAFLLSERLDDMEVRYDDQFKQVFKAIRRLKAPPKRTNLIGFRTDGED